MTPVPAMLHLAKVKQNHFSGEMELHLLAHQTSDGAWEVIETKIFPFNCVPNELKKEGEENYLRQGVLILVEFTQDFQIVEIREATNWIVNFIERSSTEASIDPEFIDREQARVEEWRQELTTKSLDLTRQQLEIETRREQLQELETSLQKEKLELEARREELKKLEASLQQKIT
jgi:hypothetical protein